MNFAVKSAALAAATSFALIDSNAVPAIASEATRPALLPSVDPIFAAIDRHKRALMALEAAQSEAHRLSELADETVGPSYIPVLNMRDSDNGWHLYVDAHTDQDICDLVPGLENQELRMFYLNKLAQRRLDREAINGDIDAMTEGPMEKLRDAEHAMRRTAPATLPGLLALLAHIGKTANADPYFLDDDDRVFFLVSLGKSAQQLA